MKYLKLIFISILLISILSVSAYADTSLPYSNYTYSEKGSKVVLGPQAYVPDAVIYGETLGTTGMIEPTDVATDELNLIYVLDAGNSRILVLNEDYTLKTEFTGFINEGVQDNFKGAKGFYVDDAYIYIADTGNQRIVIIDKFTYTLTKVVGAPKSSMLAEDFVFKPISIAVDIDRLLYVIGEGTYEGIITMDWDSEFAGFIGTNNVAPSLWEIFWMQFLSEKAREGRVQFIPQDFSGMDVDDEGFFYVTTYTKQNGKMVKRLNPGGNDVISSLSAVNIAGDPLAVAKGALKGSSSFYDVAAGPDGLYACIDFTRGKVFVYNEDGFLLYTFGARSNQDGGFSGPEALVWLNGMKVAVIDSQRNSLTVFAPTDYAVAIHEGVAAQAELDYDLAFEKWQKVLELNSGFEMAHIQSGKVYHNLGNYEQAMEEFKLGNNKELYSKSLAKKRALWIEDNITIIFIVAIVAVCALFINSFIKKIKAKRKEG